MTESDFTLDARSRLKAATPGPWHGDCVDGSLKYEMCGENGDTVLLVDHKNCEYGFLSANSDADEALVINAPTDIARLLQYVDALEDLISKVDGSCGENLAEVRERLKEGWR